METLQAARNRTWQEEARMLLSLLDCLVLVAKEAVYASSEFTTGRRFYALCRRHGVRTREDLKRRLGPEYETQLLIPNRQQGIEFALRLRNYGHTLVLTPNPFHADPLALKQNWSQDEYLEFWRMVIEQKCHAVYFNEGWEFSNGCAFEYAASVRAGIQTYDHQNRPVKPTEAKRMIVAAIDVLEKEGFQVPQLREASASLTSS